VTVRTVTGSIVKFDYDKGFGFAETLDLNPHWVETVFFRIEKARKPGKWDASSKMFSITDTPDPDANPRAQRHAMAIVMDVVQTDRGWRATKWCHRPGAKWIHDFIRSATLQQFIGGQFVEQNKFGKATGAIHGEALFPDRLVVTAGDFSRSYPMEGARHKFTGNGRLDIMLNDDTVLKFAMPGFNIQE
jgi:hypothetical protein